MRNTLIMLAFVIGCGRRDDAQDREISSLRARVEEIRRVLQAETESVPVLAQPPTPDVDASIILTLKRNVLAIESLLRRRILDDHGAVVNPGQVMIDLRKAVYRRFGGNEGAARRALINTFGIDAGLAVMRAAKADEPPERARPRSPVPVPEPDPKALILQDVERAAK